MTDMRRTLLWVVFSMSLFLIWDAWQKHNGQPSFFSPAPAKPAVASGATPGLAVSTTPATGAPGAPALQLLSAISAAPPPSLATAVTMTPCQPLISFMPTVPRSMPVMAKLPPSEQDALAAILMNELASEKRWAESFSKSQDALAKLAGEALAEDKAGLTKTL